MVQTHPEPVWQLMRGQKLYSRISDRELRLLAELGHLKAGDLLWRPGLDGWRSAVSWPGVLTPSPRPPVQSLIAHTDATKMSALLSAVWKAVLHWQVKLTLVAKKHARSMKLPLSRNHPRWEKFNLGDFLSQMLWQDATKTNALLPAAWKVVLHWQVKLTSLAKQRVRSIGLPLPRNRPQWQKFNIGDLHPQMLRQQGSSGLLIMLVFAGSIGVAILAAFAIGAQTPIENTASQKLQYRQIAAAAPDAATPFQASNFPASYPAIDHSGSQSAAQRDSVSDPPTASQSESAAQRDSVSDPPSVSESDAQHDSVANPTSVSQLDSAAQRDSVPLPTRKPEKPIAKEVLPSAAVVKRMAQRQAEREPTPMRFGSFGYNYSPQ